MMAERNKRNRGSRGSVLVLSLICLVILALIGVNTMDTSSVDRSVSVDMRSRQIAFDTAENALNAARALIIERVRTNEGDFVERRVASCDRSPCEASSDPWHAIADRHWPLDATPQDAQSAAFGDDWPSAWPDESSSYLIEVRRGHFPGLADPSYLYRVSAAAESSGAPDGESFRTTVELQEIFRPAR